MKIGIIIGSTRQGRFGEAVGHWVGAVASQRDDAQFEVVDLKDYDVQLFDEAMPPAAANREYTNESTVRWGRKIDEFDGFVFVTPEYNHSVPGVFKNAFDVLGPEWRNKTVGFVSYGADGGVRAVEHWRTIVANCFMHAVRGQVVLSLFTDAGGDGFRPSERREDELTSVLDQLVALTQATAPLRA